MGKLNIFTGKNNSGKSNPLESIGLFFSEFSLTGGTTPGLDKYFWLNRDVRNPIEYIVSLELFDDECSQVLPDEMLKAVKAQFEDSYNQVNIHRAVINVQGTWRTMYLKWAEIPLVLDDRPLNSDEVSTALVYFLNRYLFGRASLGQNL